MQKQIHPKQLFKIGFCYQKFSDEQAQLLASYLGKPIILRDDGQLPYDLYDVYLTLQEAVNLDLKEGFQVQEILPYVRARDAIDADILVKKLLSRLNETS